MTAPLPRMRIAQIELDGNNLLFTLEAITPPPAPEWVPEDGWYPQGGGDKLTFSVPVKKGTTVPATGIARTGISASGAPTYTRYTWSGSGWVNPVPVDANGQPT